MNRTKLIKAIRKEFKGVKLNGGVGLNSAKAWDDYEQLSIEDKYLIDEENYWENFSCKELDDKIAAVPYIDSIGLLFHLPAYMICGLNNKIKNDLEYYFINWDYERLTDAFSNFNYHQMRVTTLFFEYILTKDIYLPDEEELLLISSLKKILNTKLPLKEKKYTGKLNAWYENGIKQYEAEYKDGNLDGIFTAYYKNGAKKSEKEYKKGIVNGIRKSWHISGALITEGEYKNGKPFGICLGWYESGAKQYESDFTNGDLNRIIIIWHKNGAKNIETILNEKIKYRKFTEWDEKGNVIKQQEYKDGDVRSVV